MVTLHKADASAICLVLVFKCNFLCSSSVLFTVVYQATTKHLKVVGSTTLYVLKTLGFISGRFILYLMFQLCPETRARGVGKGNYKKVDV
jgi:hypothetical protein